MNQEQLAKVKDQYITTFLEAMKMPHEEWLWRTAYQGLFDELTKLEGKYINSTYPAIRSKFEKNNPYESNQI